MTLSLALVADFVLIMARTMAWLYAAPVFSDRGFPVTARATAALGLSFFLTPLLGPTGLSTGTSAATASPRASGSGRPVPTRATPTS